jgi:hypothetical protein
MARRSQLLVWNGHRIGGKKVLRLKHSPKDLPQQISKWVADNAGASDDGYDSYTVPLGDHSSLDSIEMTDVGDGSFASFQRCRL